MIAAGCGSDSPGELDAGVATPAADAAADVAVPLKFDGAADASAPPLNATDAASVDTRPALSSPDTALDTVAIPAPILAISGPTDLGTIAVGYRGTPVTFIVTNTGGSASGTLRVLKSNNDSEISKEDCGGRSLRAGETCSFQVTFHPQSPGKESALLTVDGDVSTEVLLWGMGG